MSEPVLALKFLKEGAIGPYSGFQWPTPRGSTPGRWVTVDGDLTACKRGIHACTFARPLEWLQAECYVIELRGLAEDQPTDKLLAAQGRLIRRVPEWNDRTARLFACYCATRVLPIFEKASPGDTRPRVAIRVARRFAMGKAPRAELAAAWDAARAAARDAAWDAAGDAAWDAAGDAAWDAARAAARDAARAAAWDAARAAARAAARDAAWDAARAAESKAQVQWLGRRLNVPEVAV